MKKTVYYTLSNGTELFTERQVKLFNMDKKTLRQFKLERPEIVNGKHLDTAERQLSELSTKDLRNAKCRKDLRRLGIIW